MFVNNFGWLWIILIDCELLWWIVNYFDRWVNNLWLFVMVVYSGSADCEYFRLNQNNFDWMLIFPMDLDECLQRIVIHECVQVNNHSVYIVMCLLLIAMLFSLCDWNCGNYCVLLVEVCVGAHLNFAIRCTFPTHPSMPRSWWRGVEILRGNDCLGTWIRFGTELRSWKRVSQPRLCDENTPFTKSFRMSSVSSGAVGLPWISVRMFVTC